MKQTKVFVVLVLVVCLLNSFSLHYPAESQGEKPSGEISANANITVAHLKNNLLDIYLGEQNSQTWYYQYQPGSWGESCWREHYAVYTPGTGTVESEDFAIDTPFVDPGGVPGNATAVLHSGNIQVTRSVYLPSGDARYFQIVYTVRNMGATALTHVRFFQTIDFDIPETGDHRDDYGWYEPGTDYIGVRDDDYFKNVVASIPESDRHGLDHYSTEIYDDWDDGELNNRNSYGPGDPAVGKQFNLRVLQPNQGRNVAIIIWFGDPATVVCDGDLSGDVYDAATNDPIPGVEIEVGKGSDTQSTTTDRDGHYVFDNLVAGSYWFKASKDGYGMPPTMVEVVDDVCNVFSPVMERSVDHKDLAAEYAPVWYQDVDATDPDADYITNFDFDNNWDGDRHKFGTRFWAAFRGQVRLRPAQREAIGTWLTS